MLDGGECILFLCKREILMGEFKFSKRVLFIGVPDMAYAGLETLLTAGVNIVGVVGPLKSHNTYKDFRNYVLSKKLNFIEYNSLSDDQLINNLRALNIDIATTFSFNQKIPKVFMEQIKDGILNLHPSLLPHYRGGNPYSRVILDAQKETGVTIHFMSEEFDKGDIVAQTICSIDPYETMGTIFDKTNKIGCKMQLNALIEYEQNGSLPRIKQPDGDFFKAPNIKDHERVIRYQFTAKQIDCLVRALNPYINAITLFNNQIVVVHKVSVADIPGVDNYENGAICKIENGKLYVKTAKGCIIPEVMQYGGLFLGNCEDFIKIVKPKIGDKFTDAYT